MYNENFGQFLQSLAGCIRSIWELYKKNKEEYSHQKFGIVLVWDGIDKVDSEFIDQMIEFNLFDPEVWFNTVLKTNVNKETVKRQFEKRSTSLGVTNEEGMAAERHSYATQNIAHIFTKQLTDYELREILDIREEEDPNMPQRHGYDQPDYQCQLHDNEK